VNCVLCTGVHGNSHLVSTHNSSVHSCNIFSFTIFFSLFFIHTRHITSLRLNKRYKNDAARVREAIFVCFVHERTEREREWRMELFVQRKRVEIHHQMKEKEKKSSSIVVIYLNQPTAAAVAHRMQQFRPLANAVIPRFFVFTPRPLVLISLLSFRIITHRFQSCSRSSRPAMMSKQNIHEKVPFSTVACRVIACMQHQSQDRLDTD
jgi:hypothetical protein